MISTVYVTRNGLLEPLGQSQVLAYLRGLSTAYRITLITFEKQIDYDNSEAMSQTRRECQRLGIRWLPQRFRTRPRIVATILGILRMLMLIHSEVRNGGAKLIHARSYTPAAVAMIVSRLTGVPYIFDMRALWPEELIAAGRLRRGSILHRLIVAAERLCLRGASGIVSLTHAAVTHLREVYPEEMEGKQIVVIPTCADLDRFQPAAVAKSGPRVHGCIGTLLSGWFQTAWLAEWFAVASQQDPSARFEIVTRDEARRVRVAVDPEDRLGSRLVIESRKPSEMAEAVKGHDLSVMFFTEGLSKLGSSPTRMGEVLGTGLPIVANPGVGDVARIVEENRVGVLISGSSRQEIERGLAELELLLQDRDLPTRCRAAAEQYFSLEAGIRAYRRLYDSLVAVSSVA